VIPETWLYRHDDIRTRRPYGLDVDDHDWLWEGCGRELVGHHLATAAVRRIAVAELEDRPIHQIFAWQGRLVMTLGEGPYYLEYDVATRRAVRHPVPAARPIVWYGTKTRDGKVVLFDRSESQALVLDRPDAEPRAVACPYPGQLASAWSLSDGTLLCPLYDPARLVRFDPVTARFLDAMPLPYPEVTLNGAQEHRGVFYTWDSSGGRVFPLDLSSGRWREPISAPDHGQVYGFMGGGFGVHGKAYLCLSTYTHASRLDPRTGRLVLPDRPLTLDGRPPRFLDRLLVFDAASETFEYLVAPPQRDGVPSLCYHWTDGARFAVTGIVIPYAETGELGDQYGPWLVLQSTRAIP
jgi:hypothetical protein